MNKCRFCDAALHISFCDLGSMPPSNAYKKRNDQKESIFPLHAYVCTECFLVQLGQFQTPAEIFSEYQYFSSYSKSWLKHAQDYVEAMVARFALNCDNFVAEIASNDGYLLQHFLPYKIPLLGIEPATNVARVAQEKGIPTLNAFFGSSLAKQLEKKPDLLIGNNVLAHVPDLNDFVYGLKHFLAPKGIITLEFPHLLQLMENHQFDTIYHEHFSYFSLITLQKIFSHHHLELFDVEELATHGGSLRIYVQHRDGPHPISQKVEVLHKKEIAFGLDRIETYNGFAKQAEKIKADLLNFLFRLKREGKKIAGYGAPAKGNTLLNYCEITSELLPFTVDASPYKQGHFLPGSGIPIYPPSVIFDEKPDYVLILPWNLKNEIKHQLNFIHEWEGKFLIPIPEVAVENSCPIL